MQAKLTKRMAGGIMAALTVLGAGTAWAAEPAAAAWAWEAPADP